MPSLNCIALLTLLSLQAAVHPVASDPRSLRGLAAEAGGEFIRDLSDEEVLRRHYESVDALARASTAIVVGRTLDVIWAAESANGREIHMTHKVVVESVLKGSLLPTNVVTVAELGGSVQFDDGNTAHLRRRGPYIPLGQNRAYVLFLQRREDAIGYLITGGPQGLFEISAAGEVQPADLRPETVVGLRYRRQSKDLLLQDIADAVLSR